jgi:hypothetical protein
MMLGKGVLDESSPNLVGTYAGAPSEPGVRDVLEGAGVLITGRGCPPVILDPADVGIHAVFRRERQSFLRAGAPILQAS